MFFRATIRRLFPVACATVMLCASAVAHVPRTPVPRIPLQVAQPALAGHWPSNAVAVTGSPVIHANPFLDAATYAITNLVSPAVTSGVAVPGYYFDFFGNLRSPSRPCLGAIEVVREDDAPGINPGGVIYRVGCTV
jgi:hypothetical protein